MSVVEDFKKKLEEQELVIQTITTLEDGSTLFGLEMSHKGMDCDLKIIMDEEEVKIRVFGIANVTEGDVLGKTLIACNTLNNQYKWAKFCIDKDGDVNIHADAMIYEGTGAEECFELMTSVLAIFFKAYPVLMKAVWG